jgi:putative flippase GtrA
MKTAFRFIGSGLLNTGFSYLFFYMIFISSKSVALSLLIGSAAGLFSSYFLNKFWVWTSAGYKSLRKFISIQITFLVLNWLVLHFVSLTNFSRTSAQLIILLVSAPIMYQLNKRFIFRS